MFAIGTVDLEAHECVVHSFAPLGRGLLTLARRRLGTRFASQLRACGDGQGGSAGRPGEGEGRGDGVVHPREAWQNDRVMYARPTRPETILVVVT